MRVLIITVCFPPVINGVSTRYAMTVQNLVKQGLDVIVATPGKDAPFAEGYHGARVLKTPGFQFPLNEFCDSEYLSIKFVYDLLKETKPDIVHVCCPTWAMYTANFWCWKLGIPVLNCFHTNLPGYAKHYMEGSWFGYFFEPIVTKFIWYLAKSGMNASNLTLVTSEAMRTELLEHGVINEMAVWRKGVDTELFHPSKFSKEVRSRLSPSDPKKVVLLYAGRFSPEKSLHVLAKVMEDKRIRGRAHLCLIGDGPVRDELVNKTFAHLKNDVTFIGFMNQEELAYAYGSADIFVFPSETETLGLVAIEAMASGLPVIGVNARGMTTVVKQGETGFLYNPGDIEACITYIVSLITDTQLRARISSAGRMDAEQWGWDKATKQLVDLYHHIIDKFNADNAGPSVKND